MMKFIYLLLSFVLVIFQAKAVPIEPFPGCQLSELEQEAYDYIVQRRLGTTTVSRTTPALIYTEYLAKTAYYHVKDLTGAGCTEATLKNKNKWDLTGETGTFTKCCANCDGDGDVTDDCPTTPPADLLANSLYRCGQRKVCEFNGITESAEFTKCVAGTQGTMTPKDEYIVYETIIDGPFETGTVGLNIFAHLLSDTVFADFLSTADFIHFGLAIDGVADAARLSIWLSKGVAGLSDVDCLAAEEVTTTDEPLTTTRAPEPTQEIPETDDLIETKKIAIESKTIVKYYLTKNRR